MKSLSLTGRLIAVVVACQLLLTAGVTTAAVLYARAELHRAFDAGLQGRAVGILALVRYTESNPPGLLFDSSMVPPPSNAPQQDLFQVRGPDGRLVAQSESTAPMPEDLERASADFSNFAMAGTPYRAVVLRNVAVLDDEESVKVPAHVTVTYASALTTMNWQLTRLALYIAGSSLLLLFAASAVAAWGVRRGLQPLHALATQAGAISVRNWNFRAPDEHGMAAELVPLSNAISTVLARLRDSFRQQRDFTSDAAHELKTSVAILKSTLQSLLQKPRAEQEYRAGLEGSLQDCERLEDLLDRMLRLARIEQQVEHGGGVRALAATELTSTCEAAIARIESMAAGRNIALQLVESEPAHVRADPKDLELIWINLLENAVQYSPAGSKVVLRVTSNGSGNGNGASASAQVSVEDSGCGVPPAELPYIFERFHRGDPSRARSTGGFGLGLAICKALVEAYGGRIEAANRDGQGTVVRVEFPSE